MWTRVDCFAGTIAGGDSVKAFNRGVVFFFCHVTFVVGAMDGQVVVACNFNVLGRNAETSSIISRALAASAHVLPCLSWNALMHLPATVAHMSRRGTELAAETPGITNTIARLFAELEEHKYGSFTPSVIGVFNDMGVNPVPDRDACALLRSLRPFAYVVGCGNKDSLEFEIFARKMHHEHTIDVRALFDGIVTIPTPAEKTIIADGRAGYYRRSAGWLVGQHPDLVELTARSLVYHPRIVHVATSDDLKNVAGLLRGRSVCREDRPSDGVVIERESRAGIPLAVSPASV